MVPSLVSLLTLAGLATAGVISPRQEQNTTAGVDITALSKNVSATAGTGAVSAAGTLSPFGGIGVGCGINWQEGQSFGGGLQSGSESFGLGGGFTITKEKMTVGLGIGINPINLNTRQVIPKERKCVNYEASTNGAVSLVFTSTTPIKCEETTVDGVKGVKCTSS